MNHQWLKKYSDLLLKVIISKIFILLFFAAPMEISGNSRCVLDWILLDVLIHKLLVFCINNLNLQSNKLLKLSKNVVE